MRKDSPDLTAGPVATLIADQRTTPGSHLALASRWMVWGLVFATSVAVASMSWWLVPPYLALMGVLLFEPAGRRVNATNPAGPESASSGGRPPIDAPDPAAVAGQNDEEPRASGDGPSSATAPKARRAARGRTRKARAAVTGPAPATWVQVAPGKFVRVEPGGLPAGPGPHPSQPEGQPVAVPLAAPDDAAPSLDSPARPPAEAGPPIVPPEDALETTHPFESTPTPGLSRPDGPRDLDDAADAPRDDSWTGFHPAEIPSSSASDGRHVAAVVEARDDATTIATPTDNPDEPAGPDPSEGDPPDEFEAGGTVGESAESPMFAGSDRLDAEALESPDEGGSFLGAEADFDDEWARPRESDREARPASSGTFRAWGDRERSLSRTPPSSRRNARESRADRLPVGFRRRSRRGDGRPRHFVRAFPPRSPPGRPPRRSGRVGRLKVRSSESMNLCSRTVHQSGRRFQTYFVTPGLGTGRLGASPQARGAGTRSCFEFIAMSQVITWPV